MPNLPRLIAHRGDKRYAPENTLASFRQAKAKGASWVEFDATLTRDHADPVVIFHDDAVGRTTNLPNQPITDVSFADLRAADAGKWFNYSYAGEAVPTLAETIALCDKLGLGMNIEIKVSVLDIQNTPEPFDPELARATARRVIEDIKAVRRDNWDNILLSSFSTEALLVAKEMAPQAPRGYLLHQMWPEDGFDERMPDFSRHLDRVRPYSVHLNSDLISSREKLELFGTVIRRVMGRDLPILSYTVNNPVQARALLSWGVTSLFTDAPGDLAQALDSPDHSSYATSPDSAGASGY